MKRLIVQIGMVPSEKEVSPGVSVSPGDRITDAVGIMLKNDLKKIAVVDGGKMLGVLRLADALRILGLEEVTSQKKKSFVFYGKEIIAEKPPVIKDGSCKTPKKLVSKYCQRVRVYY